MGPVHGDDAGPSVHHLAAHAYHVASVFTKVCFSGARNALGMLAFGTGIAGSFVGGLLASLLAGDGFNLRPSGIIGSIIGAIIVTLGYDRLKGSKA